MANTNTVEVELADGRTILFSYSTPVAAFIPGTGYVCTTTRYSSTTSKHVNAFANPAHRTELADDEFRALLHPVVRAR